MLLSEYLKNHTRREFILMREGQTLQDALIALTHEDGQEWWYLVVEFNDGRYYASRFSEFRERLKGEGDALAAQPLRSFLSKPLQAAEVVAHDHHGEPPAFSIVVWNGFVVGVYDRTGTRSAGKGDSPLTQLAGMETAKPSSGGLSGWGDTPAEPEPSVDQDINFKGNVGGNVNVAGRDVLNVAGDYITQIITPDKKVITVEQFRVFEAAFPQQPVVDEPVMLGVAVYVPGTASPFEPEKDPEPVTTSDKVGIQMPVNEETQEPEPVDIEVSLMAAKFGVSGKSVKYLTVWPDGKPEVRWFQLTPEEVGEHTIHIELTFNKRLLQELEVPVSVQKARSGVAVAVTQFLQVTKIPLRFNFANT